MTVMIHNKPYSTVAERLALVHGASKPFEVVESGPIQCGDHWVWRVQITLDNRQFIGSAQVHLDARPGSADATDPFACAETSAVGRALAFAGILSTESIASADEMMPVVAPQQSTAGPQNGTSNHSAVPTQSTPAQTSDRALAHSAEDADELAAIKAECKALGLASDAKSFQDWRLSVLHYQVRASALTTAELKVLREALEDHKMQGVPASPAA